MCLCVCRASRKSYIWTGLYKSKGKNTDSVVLSRSSLWEKRKIGINYSLLFVPHYTPNVYQQKFLKEHNLTNKPSDLTDNKRLIISTDIQQDDEWNFDLWIREGTDFPIYVLVAFLQIDKINDPAFNNDSLQTSKYFFSRKNWNCKLSWWWFKNSLCTG